tara:strand:+ start:644 stop:820 length:177 start_codon:yes stop_codon:yes gene_type:complete
MQKYVQKHKHNQSFSQLGKKRSISPMINTSRLQQFAHNASQEELERHSSLLNIQPKYV